jgi:hypothetical protein
MTYQVGAIEAVLQARLDDKNFDKFDRAVSAAKRSVDSMSAGQMRQAAAMKKAGVATADIAKKLGISEKAAKDYTRAQDRARLSTEKLGRSTQTAGNQMKTAVRYAIGLAAAYVGIGQAKQAITTTLEFNKAVQGLNRNLGLSVEQASRWATVAKARDIDNKSLVMSFTALSKKIEEAKNGGDSAVEVFESLGISQKDLTSGGQGFQAQLEKVAVALGDAEGGTLRQAAAQQLLGRGFQTVLPLFTQGTKSLKEQLRWADEFSTVLSDKQSKALGDVTTEMRRNKVAMFSLQQQFTIGMGPAIEQASKQFQDFVKVLSDPNLTDEQKTARIANQLNRLSDRILDVVEKMAPQVAERAGRIGIALAKGIATTFVNSGWLGKLAIGVWLIQRMGGWGALAGMGAKAGGRLAKALGKRFLRTVAPYFAVEAGANGLGSTIAARMPGIRRMSGKWGGRIGKAFGVAAIAGVALALTDEGIRKKAISAAAGLGELIINALVGAINLGISGINAALDEANIFGKLGIDAPNIPSIGNVDVTQEQIDNSFGSEGLGWYNTTPGQSTPVPGYGGSYGRNRGRRRRRGKHDGGLVGFNAGGSVPGLHPKDTVPAMLEPGEFVMRKKAVDKVGVPFLRSLNDKGEIKGEAEDGKKEIGKTFEDLGKQTKRTTEKTERQVVKTWQSMRKKTTESQGRLKRSVKDSWRDIDTDHSKRTGEIERTTSKRFRGMLKTVRTRGGDMEQSMGETMSGLQSSVIGGMGKIAKQTNNALKALGVEPVAFGIKQTDATYAGGGYISGSGKQDTVPLIMGMAAPGEAILSGPQQAEVEQSLAMTRALGLGNYGSLDSLFANVTTPHYAYARGGRLPKFASGGFTELDPAARGLAQQLQGLGFTPTSTYRADSSTYHGSRDAIDYGDAVNNQGRLWSILKPRAAQFAELFGPSYLPGPTLMHFGQGFSDSSLQAGHEDHIHVAIVNGLAGGLSPAQIKKQLLTGRKGALKSFGQTAVNKVGKAASAYLQEKFAAMGGGHLHSADGEVVSVFADTLRRYGANKKVAMALFQAGLAESGMQDLGYGDSSSTGSLQLLASTAASMGIDPHNEGQVASAFLTRGFYGNGGAISINQNDPSIPAHMIAQMVQGSAFSDGSNYLAQKSAAAALLAQNGFARGGIIRGKVSRFADSVTASGISAASKAGLALNLKAGTDSGWNNSKTQGWMEAAAEGKPYYADVGINGKSGIFPMIDVGPAGWTGRSIDVSHPAARKMGLGIGSFPTDAVGEAWILGQTRRPRKGSPSYKGTDSGKSEKQKEKEAARRQRRAERKARWDRFSKGQIKLGRSAKEMGLPGYQRPFRPKIRGQAGLLDAHSPIASDLDAYNGLFGMLGRIDPKLAELKEKYLGTFDEDRTRSVFKQQENIRRRRERTERKMREHYESMMAKELKGKDGKRPSKKEARKIRAQFSKAIRKQTQAIRKRHNPANAMKPLTARREHIRDRFETVSSRGAAVSDLLSQAQTNVRMTGRVANSGSRALAGFASGGYVGSPMAGSTPTVHITIADPTLSALDPHIEARVNGQIAQIGSITKQRQRAAGSTGRRARI